MIRNRHSYPQPFKKLINTGSTKALSLNLRNRFAKPSSPRLNHIHFAENPSHCRIPLNRNPISNLLNRQARQ